MASLDHKINSYYFTAIFSLIFAVVGFSYNAWRMELTEDNSNIRTAAFEVLTELSQLQQIIYSAHYDQDAINGNPRNAWVKIGLIEDLSTLISPAVEHNSNTLKKIWSRQWQYFSKNREATELLVKQIDIVRHSIKQTLKELE